MVSDTLLSSVSWTLIHSVWQGILLAVLAGSIILATRKSSVILRYNLLSMLFVGFLIVVGLTFCYEFAPGSETITRLNLPMMQANAGTDLPDATAYTLSDSIIEYLNRQAGLIAAIWFVIFAIRLIGIFHSLNHIYRIRNYKTFAPSDYWRDRIARLAQQINIKSSVILLESALVKVPSVTGFLKPMILVPIGMLSNLPQDQVEAILLHELAHIRRKDYAINLLQHLAEMMFFFNPGLLWLSSLIRDEREHCCDDIALGLVENKANFVHALVSFEQFNLNNQLAVGFAGKKNHLLSRAKRIIHNDNQSLNVFEKTFLSLSFAIVTIVLVACANPIQAGAIDQEAVIADEHARIMDENARVVDESTKLIDSTMAEADEKKREADRKISENDQLMEQARLDAMQARLNRLSGLGNAKLKSDFAKDKANAQVCIPEPAAQIAPLVVTQTFEPVDNKRSVTTRTVTSKTETAHTYEREITTYDASNYQGYHSSLRTGVTGERLPDDLNTDQLTSNIISDLISENVIKNAKNLSYKLSSNSLIVNGVKQPEAVYSKLKSKYVKGAKYAICYNFDYSGDKDNYYK